MNSIFKTYKKTFLIIIFLTFGFLVFSQGDKKIVKAQFGLGTNSPSANGFISNFEPNPLNFPTIILGVQYMFKSPWGAKLDFGYSRFSNLKDTPEFKVNYTRINVQLVFDATRVLSFLPPRMGAFAHAGPGFTSIKPLGNYPDNKESFLNMMGGIEFHYGISDTFSIFTDVSYIYALSKNFDPITKGYGSFNGHLLTISIGASISLSGCQFCE